jgi:hypothetical protein
MWLTAYELERHAIDRTRERLLEAERQQLIREARATRRSRSVRVQAVKALGILRGFLAPPWVVRHHKSARSRQR